MAARRAGASAPVALLQLLFVTAQFLSGIIAAESSGNDTNAAAAAARCELAIQAQAFAMDQVAQFGGVTTNESYINQNLTKLLLQQAQALAQDHAFPSMDLYMPFQMSPYISWGNMRVQAAMSASVYVPSANIGELMVAVNNVSERVMQIPEELRRVDVMNTTDIWTAAWYALADTALASVGSVGCSDVADELSCRSAVLRYINYVFTSQYANPTSEESVERILGAAELFNQTMASWEGYETLVYTTPFNNGTHDAELRTLFAAPATGEDLPLLVISVPSTWLMEIAYMRYAIGALRRGYAVLIFEGPGVGMTLRQPPYMPSYANTTAVVEAVLDTAAANPDIEPKFDSNAVVLMGLESGSYSIGRPCILLQGRVAACVMSPPVPSLANARASRMVVRFYGPYRNISEEHPELFPSEDLAEVFKNPKELIYDPLLNDCPADSAAPGLFGAVFYTSGLLPDTLYPILTDTGGGPDFDSPDKILAASWQAWKRAQENDDPWDPAAMQVPVLLTHGEDDLELIPASAEEVFSRLPESVRADSRVKVFGEETGGALAGQRGATPVFEQILYPFLTKALEQAKRRRLA